MDFKDINELEQTFMRGDLGQFPESLTVSGIVYGSLQHRSDVSWQHIVENKTNKALSLYAITRNPENVERMQATRNNDDRRAPNEILAFGWSMTRAMSVKPIGNAFTSRARLGNRLFEGTDISYDEDVRIDGINGNEPIQAKIDTGADVCSLHAENIQMNGDSVSFSINGRSYNMSMVRTQSIKQADSEAEQRPVVSLNISIAGQIIPNVECNLNDRSGMSSPLLIGKNLLGKHDFTIHTLQTENDELSPEQWNEIDGLFEGYELNEDATVSEDSTEQLIRLMQQSDCSLQDLLERIYQQGMHNANTITY